MAIFSQKPLVLAIRALIGFALVSPQVKAELPVPSAAVNLSIKPIEIATQGQATAAISGNNMTIQQGSDKAVLDWQKFNVGVENSVKFEQPSSSSIALNNIHQADASKIMGTISANGQVYLVNQNGFVFGKDSQVNVNSLVATTLGISNDIFQKGITKAFDIDGSAALQGAGDVVLKDDKGNPLKDASGNLVKIQIIIAKGASIKTNAPGGRVIIAAPSITNEGDIETPDGQAILAASKDKVYLQEAGVDDSTRGLVVEVGKGGEVNNVGKVLAERGNASLLGFAVNQKGIVSATTSVKLNGSVRLLAHEGVQDRSGTGGKLLPQSTLRTEDEGDGLGKNATVNLAENSRTSVDLATDKTETAIDAQAQTSSTIEVSGHDVVVQNNATIEAKSGKIDVAAIDNLTDSTQKGTARIYLESGSHVDVSGVKAVTLPVERNVVKVEIRKNELRDAPLQRDGILYGKTVAVDVRDATLKRDSDGKLTSATIPVADIKGAVDRIERNIDERSTIGGKITLKSSGDVIAKTNSNLDFSGGSINYQDGVVETTQLTSNGQVFSIAKADSNLNYDGIITNKVATSGYVEGKSGGALVINSYESVLDGNLHGETVSGVYQRDVANKVAGSSLSLDLNNNNSFGKQAINFAPQPNAIVMSANDVLPRKSNEDLSAMDLQLSADTFQKAGISNVDIKTNGGITLAKEAVIHLPNYGGLKIAAKDVDIQGSIIAPSGNVDIQPIKIDGTRLPNAITLGDSAVIDTSGKWINDVADSQNVQTSRELTLDGGSVSLQSEQADLRLATGSRIDVSGGAAIDVNNKTTVGKAGAINLVATSHDAGGQAASLVLEGKLEGWGVTQGGSLNLTSNEVIIGSASNAPQHADSKATPLILNPDFFRQNGFSNYTVNAYLHGLTVADNVQLKPLQQNIQLNGDAVTKPTGSNLRDVGSVITLPDALRNSTNLTLSLAQPLAQTRAEVLTIGENALIQGDAQATINLNSDTSIILNGTIDAPAGNINLTINAPTGSDTGFFDSQGIWLSSDSRLSAKGIFKPTLNPLNLTTGDVLAGGNIALIAKRGYIVSRENSAIDVSGTAKTLDFIQSNNSNPQLVSQTISSTGGTITLKAGEGIIADGKFQAKGGEGAAGGSLVVELNSGLRSKPDVPVSSGLFPDDENNALTHTIEITNTITPTLSNTVKQGDAIASEIYSGRAVFKNEQLNSSIVASLELKTDVIGANGDYAGGILFNGDITLNATKQILLDSPQLQTTKGNVTLNTAYAALGSTQSRLDSDLGDGTFSTTLAPQAVNGLGQFNVVAKNIDLIGGLSFKNFNQVNLNSAGDLRTTGIRVRSDSKDYLGEFKLDGNLTLTAAQIYPATLSNYKFSIAGENGSVVIKTNGLPTAPVYSAAGILTIDAANITQSGVLKAPFGSLNLNARNFVRLTDGSVTSVSGDGVTVPFGKGSGGLNWLYPFDANGSVSLVVESPPEKRLTLTGREVDLQKGAKVNLNGGGDLVAYEFITGAGGTQDVLNNNTAGNKKFAVLPDLGHALTPYDPLESTDSNIKMGDSVYLNAGSGLSAGWYTILPAHYALLPDAYLVTPLANTQDWSPTQTAKDLAGTTLVAGRYGDANAGIQNPRWQGFSVQSGKVARTYSEYTDYFANDFFAEKATQAIAGASQLPQDAGSLAIAAQTKLTLNADLFSLPVNNGRGSFVDVSADHLAIVGRREDVTENKDGETVSLFVDDLNKLNAPSLLLGGTRSKNKDGQVVTVNAQTLTIASDAKLTGSDIILAAKNTLKVSAGAKIQSIGKNNSEPSTLQIITNAPAFDEIGEPLLDANGKAVVSSDSAFLRLSSASQTELIRTGKVTGESGVLIVEKGATLQADNAMLLDSTKDTAFAGDIVMNGGSLGLNASRISLGNAPSGTVGLVLSSTDFTLDELKLNSRSDLDIYGAVNMNTQKLSIDAAAIRGLNNANQTATISAKNIILSNHGATASADSKGSGTLELKAKNIQLGSGQYAMSGFNQVKLDATETLSGLGQIFEAKTGNSRLSDAGNLRVAGDLIANASRFTSGNGATTNIDATGHNASFTSSVIDAAIDKTTAAGLGGFWSITADAINNAGRFDLPSGTLKLNALNGDISLNSGSLMDVSGREIAFDSVSKFSPAGNIELVAPKGNVILADNAQINLAGLSSNSGTLNVDAPTGKFVWNGTVTANSPSTVSDFTTGSLSLNVADLGDFSTLNTKLTKAGFSEKVDLIQNHGDVIIATNDPVQAREFNLAANQGKVFVNGAIEAKNVGIYGNDGVSFAGKIIATNGSVTFDTVHQHDAGSGLLDLSAKGSIDTGLLHFRTGRNDEAKTVNISAINTAIKSENVVLEATRVYENQSDINNDTIAQFQKDTADFMNNAPRLQNNSGAKISLLPGIDVRSEGDLTLSTTWDFANKTYNEDTGETTVNWRYDDGQGNKNVAGFLTLKAKKDVLLNASLTDAFANTALLGTDETSTFQDVLQAGSSWNYKISAGNAVKLANAYFPLDEYGEPAYDPSQVVVRTGTGNIDISAGGNIQFVSDTENSSASAAIYTAGKPADYTKTQLLNGEIAGIPRQNKNESEADYLNRLDPNQMNALLRYGYVDENLLGLQFRVAEYPTQGGSIHVNAGGNISGINTGQEISDWLVRSGVMDENNRPTAWGINLSGDKANSDKGVHFFNQNIGALGGGNVTINARGDISNLSAMLPTTGKPFGKLSEASTNQWIENGTIVNGGGDLRIHAGNNIVGGEYFVALGSGKLNAGGSVLGSGEANLGALLELSDANFNVQARQNIVVGSVFNPTVLKQNVLLPNRIGDSRFFTYSPNSDVSFTATAGNVVLQNDIAAIKSAKGRDNDSETGFEYAVYPASLEVAALSGDLSLNHSMTLFPDANGKLELLANNNVGVDETAGQVISINMSDADPALLPSVQNPTQQMEGSLNDGLIRTRERLDPSTPNPTLIHANQPLHSNTAPQPVVQANLGSITFPSQSEVTFFMPQAVDFIAGKDINNLSLSAQQLKESDISQIRAGRDINFDAIVDDNGIVQSNDKQIEIGGVGEVQILAGRNISLGGSAGINTIGNTKNSVLAKGQGASISLVAGSTDAVEKSDLSHLFNEIKQSALAAASASDSERKALYQKGYDAIDLLFPKKAEASGDLSLVFSQIKTLAGGDINVAIPNGSVNVGLAGMVGGVKKGASQLGIVAQQSGDINAFTQNNFNVNQSRVFTMGGGDITIWSSQGNIDAGKGAKSSISAPAPITKMDSHGNIVTIFPPVVSGSGIQTINPQDSNAKQGNVYLAAPTGIVDAGEAGISGGKIVIAANAVVGASNISASGGSVGVPTSVPAPSVPSGASNAAASAAKSATQMNDETNNPNNNQNDSTKDKKKSAVSVISTDVIGYGNCTAAEVRDGKEGCGS